MTATPEDDLELERQADYRRFTLSGNHYEMGQQWGIAVLGEESEPVTEEEAAEVAQLLGLSIEQLAALDLGDEPAKEEVAQDIIHILFNGILKLKNK